METFALRKTKIHAYVALKDYIKISSFRCKNTKCNLNCVLFYFNIFKLICLLFKNLRQLRGVGAKVEKNRR